MSARRQVVRPDIAAGPRSRRVPRRAAPLAALLPARDAWLVALAAIALRVLYWSLYSHTPFFRHPVIDGSFFDLWAQAIAAGREFQPDVWFKPPLYAYGLGLLYRICGHAPLLAYALQAALGVLNALLVLAIGRLATTPRIARIGALAAALLPIMPFLELQLVAEALTTFLSLAALLALLLARRDGGGWRAGALFAGGLLLGVAATGRPNILLVLPAAAWWAWRETVGSTRGRARPALIVLLAGALALAPTTLRNLSVGGAFAPVSANFGVNLWTGHGPDGDGVSAVPVGVHWDDLQLQCRQAGAGQTVTGSRYLTRLTRREIAARPGRALGLLGKKALVLVGAHEARNNIGPSFLAREYGVFPLGRWWPGFWLLGPFALLGLAGAWRGGAATRLLALYLAALAVSVLPFFVNARFRAPLLPVATIFAAAAVDDLVRRWRAGGARPAARRVTLLAVLGVIVNVNWFSLGSPRDDARDHYNLAMAFSSRLSGQGVGSDAGGWRAQDPQQAREHFERAMALDSDEPDYVEGYGQLLLQLAQPAVTSAQAARERGETARAASLDEQARPLLERALALHRRAAELFPRSFRSFANRGTALLWLGDAAADAGDAVGARDLYDEAIAALADALRIDPAFRIAADNLAAAQERRRLLLER